MHIQNHLQCEPHCGQTGDGISEPNSKLKCSYGYIQSCRKLGYSPFRTCILYFLHINYPHITETRGAASPGEKRQNLFRTERNQNYLFKCYFSNRRDICVFLYIYMKICIYAKCLTVQKGISGLFLCLNIFSGQ